MSSLGDISQMSKKASLHAAADNIPFMSVGKVRARIP